ncbi:metabolite-proton symporter [Paraperlucidibaca baekdonensis]|uniref:Metabolite-proton symporter n=2 Tax=Paraperlucidibaca baekdonensis TaxID=748120 RepID=A0A3E0HA16_9GAMM|nr:metabolite-proton symporter [Paraperlucidibaca baekdonensis]
MRDILAHLLSQLMTSGNSKGRVLFASLIGTTIEFFDFYIYATAAVLVFPTLFFPNADPTTATLQSLATFAVAFFARPLGSAVFGHYGDRIGRKATLVAALLTMGLSTVAIGFLPTYAQIGVLAPALLALCRFGQGLGLGGEWGGAVLLATENAPPGKRAWFGMFPQLGAPLGFLLSSGTFLALTHFLSNDDFMSWGWRIPFIASSLLVFVGLYVRLRITETPAFTKTLARNERAEVPMVTLFREHGSALFHGTVIALTVFVVFYLMTVFTLSWGTTALGYSRETFLKLQMFSMVFFAATIPLSAIVADRYGRRVTLMVVGALTMLFGLAFEPLFVANDPIACLVFLILGLSVMGLGYGPLGTLLAELFPTRVRYTGASLTFNLAGIFGASLAPYAATWLATDFGLSAVGGYMALAAGLSLWALSRTPETQYRDD